MPGLDRRDFLKTAGVLAAGAALATTNTQPPSPAPAPATPGAPRKRTLRKAVMIGMVQEGSTILDRFKLLRDTGFEGAELDSPSPIKPEEVLDAAAKTGLKVHGLVDSVHWKMTLTNPVEEVRAEGVAALETALRDGNRYGSISILLVPGIVDKDAAYDDAYARSQAEIRKVLPLAEQMKVKIAIENVWNNFLLSPLEAARYVDEFNSPWVGWHFDIGNVINFGWPEQWVRILGKRILKLHIKDFSRAKRDKEGLWKGFDVELLEGDAGWHAVMAALDLVGYSTAPEGK